MRSDFSLSYCTEVGHTRSTRAFFATHKLLKRFMKAQLLEQSGTSRVVWGHREYIKIGILVVLATAVVQKELALTARSMKTTRLISLYCFQYVAVRVFFFNRHHQLFCFQYFCRQIISSYRKKETVARFK